MPHTYDPSSPFSPTSADKEKQPPLTPMDTSFAPFSPALAVDTPMEDQMELAFEQAHFDSNMPVSPTSSISTDISMDYQSTQPSPLTNPFAANTISITTVPSCTPPTFSSRRAANDAVFREKLQQMALPLASLVQLSTGEVHPRFPGTLLNFWLLTDAELESLAHFYHQRTPSRWTFHYPCPITWSSDLSLEEKRRKIGKFIGLRGCESPVRVRSEEELLEEARRARTAADEEEMWRRKLPWY